MDKYLIKVQGCDDSTHVTMELNDNEVEVICRVAKYVAAESTYVCMPVLIVEKDNKLQCPTIEEIQP